MGDASEKGRLAGSVKPLKNWLEWENSDVYRRIGMAAPRRSYGIDHDIVLVADQRPGSGPCVKKERTEVESLMTCLLVTIKRLSLSPTR